MAWFRSEKTTGEEKGLRYKLAVIENLVFAVPFLVISYFLYQKGVFEEPSNLVIFAMILVLILAGMIILRQVFDRFNSFALFVKKASSGETVTVGIQKDAAELHDISQSFSTLMDKLQKTTDDLSRRVLELFVIKELTEIANQKTDVESLLIAVLSRAMSVTKARIGSVFMVEPGGKYLRLIGSRGPGGALKKDAFIPIEDSVMKFVVQEKSNLLVRNIETDPRTLKPNGARYETPSFLSMPIFIGDEVAAVINLANKEKGDAFDAEDEQILAIMLGEISFAVENAQLRARIEEYVKTLEDHAANLEREIGVRKRIENVLRDSEQKYMELSITDSLTGLYNRRHFFSQLRAEIDRTVRYCHPLTILLMDIDNFKDFNDAYGHPEGDKVLVRLAEIISGTIRKTDFACRYGGEEFAVLLPETPGQGAVSIADRILSQFRDHPFHPTAEVRIHTSVSIGVAQLIPGEEMADFVKRADDSMYEAKKQGKDRIVFQQPPDDIAIASSQKPLALD
jgi:diguanylate cyclase (GGDEF)-like protein